MAYKPFDAEKYVLRQLTTEMIVRNLIAVAVAAGACWLLAEYF